MEEFVACTVQGKNKYKLAVQKRACFIEDLIARFDGKWLHSAGHRLDLSLRLLPEYPATF